MVGENNSLFSSSIKTVSAAIASGVDVNDPDPDRGDTPLTASIKEQNIGIARLLIRSGADVDIADGKTDTPLIIASRQSDIELMRLLISSGADATITGDGAYSAIHAAAASGNAAFIPDLIRAGADPLVSTTEGNAYHIAILHDHSAVVAALLNHGVPVLDRDLDDEIPLTVAVRENWRCAHLLSDGYAIFHTLSNYPQEFQEVINHGADIEVAAHGGITPLMFAIEQNKTKETAMILDQGPILGRSDHEGNTALHYLARGEKPSIVVSRFMKKGP
jgi:ankyrin repeat protein